MNKTELMNKATRAFHKVGFQLKKHSPEILLTAGIVGGVATVVFACKATLKVNEVIEPAKENIEKIHEAKEKGITQAGESYSIEDSKKDLVAVYAQTGIKLVKLYAPAFALGTLSVTSILVSHKVMRTRNLALAAAYTAVDTGFKEYRNRVVERFGEELDKELKYNIKAKEVETTVVDEEGNEKTVTEVVNVKSGSSTSPYAFIFDEWCTGWTKDPERNKFFLCQCQEYANRKLRTQGYLFLNDVREMVGLPRTKAGQIVGWLYTTDKGDGYVDFRIFDVLDEAKCDFVNGRERSIIIDPNVDGVIVNITNSYDDLETI